MKAKIIALILFSSLLLSSCSENIVVERQLSKDVLSQSLSLGTEFLLNNQKDVGNFTYEYNFLTKEYTEDDNQVRQAGALWGLALINLYSPTEELQNAIENGIAFFESNTKDNYIVYPNEGSGSTGTMALTSLALIEYLRSNPNTENLAHYEDLLDTYLDFLLSLRKEDGTFSNTYNLETGAGSLLSSPYYDGESLLAITKAAKYLGKTELGPLAKESAKAMHKNYVTDALTEDPDSNLTKGFYQWGSMSFYELFTSDWKDNDFDNWTIDLANWMIDVHETLSRTKNTAYAYEGIIHAYELANGKEKAKFEQTIDTGLYKLTSWQVGSPIANSYLQENPTEDPLAIGGIMNEARVPTLRIDVTQHQMHAVILALEYLYE